MIQKKNEPKVHAADLAAMTGPFVQVNVEQLKSLGEAAIARSDGFKAMHWIRDMSVELAQQIRKWRVEEGCTWREVAATAHDDWEAHADPDWLPPWNQLMGMALCERAAELLGEDYMKEPWN